MNECDFVFTKRVTYYLLLIEILSAQGTYKNDSSAISTKHFVYNGFVRFGSESLVQSVLTQSVGEY